MTRDWESALRAGDAARLQRLLDDGADINARDAHGQTALMLAARNGRTDVVRLFVARGADLNHSAKYHLTALMLAVINGHADVVQILLDAGADTTPCGTGAPGFAGKTARDLARAAGRHDVEACFERSATDRPTSPDRLPET